MTIRGSEFRDGWFVNAVISFQIIAAVLYSMILRPMNVLKPRAAPKKEEPTVAVCPNCLSPQAIGARRCEACNSWLIGDSGPVS